jgi:rhamnose transport system ATP-binding protein
LLLEAIGLHKSYGGVRALRGVSLELRAGEVHALIGENGAGKSTLIKILTGAVQPDSGEIRLGGKPIEHNDPSKARKLGVAVIYQQPALFPDLTVSENIAISNDVNSPWRTADWKARRSNAGRLLERIGANISPDVLVASLSMPEQQLVEIAKALDANASVLIMDEPTASLGERDAENLFRIVLELRASGTGIIYISHRLEELFHIADRVTVLRDGDSVGTHDMAGVTARELIRMMVGRELDTLFPKKAIAPGVVAFELQKVGCKQLKISGVSLTIRRGEILGLAGLVGSGRTQLAEALFGLVPITEGAVYIDGQAVDIRSPADAVHAGLAYVPEDRRRHGVILEMPISMNMTLASLDKVSRHGLLQMQAEQDTAREFQERLQIKTPSLEALAKNLSGGNQQKVALARWLMTKPKILILDEPTQGIDVHAKSEIYRLIGELAESGLAVLLISSDMPEVLGMCDRIAVMAKGQLVGTVKGKDTSPDEVLSLALGHRSDAPGRLN